jgi:hypothetical protein
MTTIDTEAGWISRLALDHKLHFLARLSFEITIAGRNSYEAGTDELTNPRQLRRVNEIQHRVTACLSQLLSGTCPDGFEQSIATWVLAERDPELKHILELCWSDAKMHLNVD